MPLSNIIIKNFRLNDFLVTDSTVGNQVWGGSSYIEVADTNTFPKSALITISASSSTENPIAGSEGYWGFGTNNLLISGYGGETSWKLLVNQTSSATNSYGQPYHIGATTRQLKDTEYDPAGGGNYATMVASSIPFDARIGYDFWQYNLLQENGESYEPTAGQPNTYYKYWLHPDSVTNSINASYPEYAENWNPLVKKIVAVNSMPLNAMSKAQQGNKVFVIVVFQDDLTGQDFVDAGMEIRVDLDGNPDFTEFVEDEINQFPNDWQMEDVEDEAEDTDISNGQTTTTNTLNDNFWAALIEGIDPDDFSFAADNEVSEDQELNISVSDSEVEELWGNDGLTESEIDAGSNNVSGYDALAAESADSVDEDTGPGISDNNNTGFAFD